MEEYENKGRRYYIFWTLVRIILCIIGSWVWGCDVVISLVSGVATGRARVEDDN